MDSDAGREGGRRSPAAVDAGGSGDAPTDGPPTDASDGTSATGDTGGFGVRGWVLVGVVVLSTAVVPGLIYAFPALPADAGLPFLTAMLVLPLVPAALLGATAVWSMSAAAASADDRD